MRYGRAFGGHALVLALLACTGEVHAAGVTQPLIGRVDHVADGDTLTITSGGTRYRIRLHEIDAPEHDQPWGAEARQALSTRVDGKYVRVQVETVDDYGRTVGKVLLGDRDINRELVREGHAWVYRRYLKDPSLLEDEAAAREARRGLWSGADPVPPWRWRHSSRTRPDSRQPEPVGHCDIKGNVNRRGERIYHAPGDPSYAETRIDPTHGERWFCSREAAERAGWRAPR